MKYTGSFEYFCEMGGSPSLMFKDKKTKYLKGYSELDMCYFIKFEDEFFINGEKMKFTINSENEDFFLVPESYSFKEWKKFIDNNKNIILETNKKLYKDLIIIDLSMNDEDLEENLNRLLKEESLSKNNELIKKELNYYLKSNKNILDYVRKKEFYGLSGYDIFLNNGSIIKK